MRGIVVGSLALAAVLVATEACSAADGNVSGGDLRPGIDAAAPPVLVTEFPGAPATTWRGLYRDFFSKNAPSGCAQFARCHASASTGASLVSKFVCADADSCWDSMRYAKHPVTNLSLVEASAIGDPGSAQLFTRLRYLEGFPPKLAANGGTMPEEPVDFAFTAEAIERMKTWIRNGAKKD